MKTRVWKCFGVWYVQARIPYGHDNTHRITAWFDSWADAMDWALNPRITANEVRISRSASARNQ